MGALVCMSRWDIPACPGDVIKCQRSCAVPGSGLFAAHFPRTMSLLALIGGARCPLVDEIDAYMRQDLQAKMHSDPDRDDFLLITKYEIRTVLLCAKIEYVQAHIYVFAPALPELLWLPTVWRCPYIEIAFSTLDCSIVPTCGAWCSATAAKRGPLKQSWAGIQHSRDGEPLGVLMQMRNARVNGFFFFSSLGVLPGVFVDALSLCSGNVCVECVLIVLHKFYIEL